MLVYDSLLMCFHFGFLVKMWWAEAGCTTPGFLCLLACPVYPARDPYRVYLPLTPGFLVRSWFAKPLLKTLVGVTVPVYSSASLYSDVSWTITANFAAVIRLG